MSAVHSLEIEIACVSESENTVMSNTSHMSIVWHVYMCSWHVYTDVFTMASDNMCLCVPCFHLISETLSYKQKILANRGQKVRSRSTGVIKSRTT